MIEQPIQKNNPSGKILKRVRKALGLTQVEMARLLGVTERTIRSWEKEETEVKLSLWQMKKFFQLMVEAGHSIDILPDPPTT